MLYFNQDLIQVRNRVFWFIGFEITLESRSDSCTRVSVVCLVLFQHISDCGVSLRLPQEAKNYVELVSVEPTVVLQLLEN